MAWFGSFKKCNFFVSVFEYNFDKVVVFSNYSQRNKILQSPQMPEKSLQSVILTALSLFPSLFVTTRLKNNIENRYGKALIKSGENILT